MSMLNRALGLGRHLAEARMTEIVIAGEYEDGTDETGDPTRVLVVKRYEGKGRVKFPSLAVSESTQPSQVVSAQEPLLSIPTGSPTVFEGDEVHVISSTVDQRLVGRSFRVLGDPQSGQTTSHRYPLKGLT